MLPFTKQRVLVTGGAGFIGSHLVQALLEKGAIVRVLDNFSSGTYENLEGYSKEIELIEGDVRELSLCKQAMLGITHVLHQAAIASVPFSLAEPAVTMQVNVQGTANLLQAARDNEVKRVILASSASVYGTDSPAPSRESVTGRNLSPYALSKYFSERLAETHSSCFGLETVALRYFNVYGPRQNPEGPYASVIPRFLAARIAGVTPVIYGDGGQSRDFIYVSDVVKANLLALRGSLPKHVTINVGTGVKTTVSAVAEAVDRIAPSTIPFGREVARPQELYTSVADTSLAEQYLGFHADVALADGLARTYEALRKSR
jgi:nucleoside-diphosphate-sugar epimerase